MLALKCGCLGEPLLPILVTNLQGNRPFSYTHCVFCRRNITWTGVPEEKIKEAPDIHEVPEADIRPEQLKWYREKLNA